MSRVVLITTAFVSIAATAALAQATPPAASQTPTAPSAGAPAAPTAATPAGPASAFQNFRMACGKEIRTVCGQPPKGDKQARELRLQCVDANKAKFSADCQAAIDARHAERQARKDARRSGAAEKPKL